MRFSEGSFAAGSAAALICSLFVARKFREGFKVAFRTPILNTQKDLAALSGRGQILSSFWTYCLMTQTLISGWTSA